MRAVRFSRNPIITPETPGLEGPDGANINGPSLIRAPGWIPEPLGRYYLYFASHSGKHIRLAYADALAGPWTVHRPGTLRLEQTVCRGHIGSPDVHVDGGSREIRMYFHGPSQGAPGQVSFLATSADGLHFSGGSAPAAGTVCVRGCERAREAIA